MADLVEKVAEAIGEFMSARDRAYGEHRDAAHAAIAIVLEEAAKVLVDAEPPRRQWVNREKCLVAIRNLGGSNG